MLMKIGRRSPEGSTQNAPAHTRYNRFYPDFDWRWLGARDEAFGWSPDVELIENDEGFYLNIELPGVNPDDVALSVENGALTIRGEKRATYDDTQRVHRAERPVGRFERTFNLPRSVDVDRISARTQDGVLAIELPKSKAARPRQIAIRTK